MKKHYHFIGIGGIGMSGIAQLLLAGGYEVSGSDLKQTKITDRLKQLGAVISIGHDCSNLKKADIAVYSSAIKADNPEFLEAKRQGIVLVRRAQVLAEIMCGKTVIAVTGSHGKTTTSSLAANLLFDAGFSPTAAIGGILRNIDNNAFIGCGRFFVAEADESDGSFLSYAPVYSVITNIDYEHMDYYHDLDNVLSAYRQFMENTVAGGCVFYCADDEKLARLARDYSGRRLSFGMTQSADIYPDEIIISGLSSSFDCYYRNKFLGRFELALGGRHNISNSLAVIALGVELGIDTAAIKKSLAEYKGARRRLEVKFRGENCTILDDYAHHPTEIKETLKAACYLPAKRLVAVFQPHRYSRAKLLVDEFAASFDLVDCLIVTDIYPAGESPVKGIDSAVVFERIKKYSRARQVRFVPRQQLTAGILGVLKPNDLVITLGAGDIIKVADELAEEIKRQSCLRRIPETAYQL